MFRQYLLVIGILIPSIQGTWYQQSDVCFGTSGDQKGSFSVSNDPGYFIGIRLEHINGTVSCSKNDPTENQYSTLFGCQRGTTLKIGVSVTTKDRAVIFPREFHTDGDGHYDVPGFNANSTVIAFSNLLDPVLADKNDEFQVWYNRDLLNRGEKENIGKSCVKVFALMKE